VDYSGQAVPIAAVSAPIPEIAVAIIILVFCAKVQMLGQVTLPYWYQAYSNPYT